MVNYRIIFDALSAPSFILELEQGEPHIIQVNPAASRWLQSPAAKLPGTRLTAHFPPFLVETVQKALTGDTRSITDRTRTFKGPGKADYFAEFTCLDQEEQGKILLMQLFEQEEKTSDSKKLREDLSVITQERKFWVDRHPDGLFATGPEGEFVKANEGLARITGIPREKLLSLNLTDLAGKYGKKDVELEVKRAREGQDTVYEVRCPESGRIIGITLRRMDPGSRMIYGIATDLTEIRKVQDLVEEKDTELIRREKKYQALVQEAFDLVGIVDIKGNYVFVSGSTRSILGIRPEDYLGKNAFSFVHPDDRERVARDFSAIEKNKKIKISPFRFPDANGHWRWVETTVTNMLDDPYVQGLVVNSREISEIIDKNNKIRELYERYKLAAAATGDLIYDWDLITDKVKRFFKGKARKYGYERKELEQRNFWRDHVHPEEMEDLRNAIKKTLPDPTKYQLRLQYRFRRRNGTYVHLLDRCRILRDEKGKAVRVIGATSDLTGILNRRDALRMANQRFLYAMKATQEMIWDWNIREGFISRSNSFKRIFGYEAGSRHSVETFWLDKICPEDRDRVHTSLFEALGTPGVTKWQEEYRFTRVDGERAYVIDRGFIIRDRQGTAVRMVGATLDVTESRKMLREIRKQNKVLREIAWEQAHVVRAPLARLKGLMYLLEEDNHDGWDEQEILKHIKSSADELDKIVVNIIKRTEEIETNEGKGRDTNS